MIPFATQRDTVALLSEHWGNMGEGKERVRIMFGLGKNDGVVLDETWLKIAQDGKLTFRQAQRMQATCDRVKAREAAADAANTPED